jgi:uncharacterized protein YkwD
MKRLAAAILTVLLAAAAPAAADPVAALLADINAARAKQGLVPVHQVALLAKVARGHAAAMAERGFFDHRGPDGKRIAERLADAGYGFLYAGENLSAGIENPDTVVKQWLLSPSHRDNLLEPRAREAGIGLVVAPRGPYRYYWTLILAEPAQR